MFHNVTLGIVLQTYHTLSHATVPIIILSVLYLSIHQKYH